jgi:hypothetical protein
MAEEHRDCNREIAAPRDMAKIGPPRRIRALFRTLAQGRPGWNWAPFAGQWHCGLVIGVASVINGGPQHD